MENPIYLEVYVEPINYLYSVPYHIFLIYLVILLGIEFERINKWKSIKDIRACVIISYLIFIGLRKFIGWDWTTYYPFFAGVKSIAKQGYSIYFEIGFIAYTVFIKTIFNNYFFWVFTSTLIDIILLDYILREYSKYYVLGFIFYYIFLNTVFLDIMRNSKTILLFMASLRFIKERKMLPYMFINGMGILFHASAALYLPLYFILNKEFPLSILLTIFIVGNIIFLSQINYVEPIAAVIANIIGGRFPDFVKAYFSRQVNIHSGISLGYIERTMTYILIMIFYAKLIKANKMNILFINIYTIYFICFTFFASAYIVSGRMSLLFKPAYFVIYPAIFACIKTKINKYSFLLVLFLYSSVAVTSSYRSLLHKYDNILFLSDKTFEEVRQVNLSARKYVEKR